MTAMLAFVGVGVLVAGAVFVAFLARRDTAEPAYAPEPPAAHQPAEPGLPEWQHADTPLLTLDQLGGLMREMAARAGIPERVLPSLGSRSDGEGAFIDRGASYYRYVGLERGAVSFEHRTPVADRLMYLVFRDRSWMIAAGYVVGHPAPPEQDPAKIAAGQVAILARIDPRWGELFAHGQGR